MKQSKPIKRYAPIPRKRLKPRRKEGIPFFNNLEPTVKKEKESVKVFPSGREVCCLSIKAGRDEYFHRTDVMFERQGKRCGLVISPQCKERNGKWPRNMIQFGHPFSKGFSGGKRDDRIEIDGKPTMARALCPWCNLLQGSKPMTDFLDVI